MALSIVGAVIGRPARVTIATVRKESHPMPELPEVETVRRGLDPVFRDQVFASVQVNRPDLRWPFPENMAARIAGTRVTALRRR